MHRRALLKAILCLTLSARTLGFAKAQPAAQPGANAGPRRFIDVHCHFFNAADLPVRGFLERVALADYSQSRTAQASLNPAITLRVWRGMAAKLAELVIKQRAPGAQQELDCLSQSGSCRGFNFEARRPATRELVLPAAGESRSGEQPLADVLLESYARPHPRERSMQPSSREAAKDQDADEFVDFVLKEMQASGDAAPEFKSRSLSLGGPSARSAAQSIANYLSGGRSFFSRYFQWAHVLTDYRANIAASYRKQYDPDKSRLILATPALVDYNFWLDDQSPSPIRDQVELMGQLSLRSEFPMHGFAPFDPLREVRRKPGEPSSLEIVKEAVQRHGFLGAKLYSPMGFRPSGNAEAGLPFPASASNGDKSFGRSLDEALDTLYAWCQAEDAPILAHSTDSQSAGPDFASRAEPRFWRSVLTKYPRLRLNLAHFGNFTQAFGQDGDPAAWFDKTWEYETGVLINSGHFPNLYADISYFWWVLEGSGEAEKVKAVKGMLGRYLAQFDPKVERLLFGTDWCMSGKAKGSEHYVDEVENFFRDVGLNDAQLDNLFYKNALRFLGLQGSTKIAKRLRSFYAAAGKPYPSFA